MGRLIRWVSLGGLNVAELSGSALELMADWMRQYGDLPMDLADASLLWVAQEHGPRRIATLDRSDFGIVRLPGGESLENLLDHEHSVATCSPWQPQLALASRLPPTAAPRRSGGPIPRPPLAQGRSLKGTGAQQSTLSMPAKALPCSSYLTAGKASSGSSTTHTGVKLLGSGSRCYSLTTIAPQPPCRLQELGNQGHNGPRALPP